jgi:glycosyltransferase involved in cell wall biosynthesis
MTRSRVLVISHDVVDTRLAGPGIRYRELARVLAQHLEVTLAIPYGSSLDDQPFKVCPYHRGRWDSLAPAANLADVIITPGDSLAEFPALEKLRVPLVVDGYDPHALETLALWAGEPLDEQTVRHDMRLDILRRQCRAGDFFVCASERQRDWWLGLLERQGRVNPHTYAADPSLRTLIDVVPYGLPSEPPRAMRPVLRGVWAGIRPEDLILLWGGGLWQWLDPLTAVRAVYRLVQQGMRDVRLVFPGTHHPNPDMPDMPMRAATLALAHELGLEGKHIFFGDWVPHEDWPAVLLESDVGLSLHPDTVEARLAFRSRVLDYIWAGLPMVVSSGDSASEMVRDYGLGEVVPPQDVQAVAAALDRLLKTQDLRGAYHHLFDRVRSELTWEWACEPIVRFCQNPVLAADRSAGSMPSGSINQQTLTDRDAEIERLRDLVRRYEQGRFMRFMRRCHRWRERLGDR